MHPVRSPFDNLRPELPLVWPSNSAGRDGSTERYGVSTSRCSLMQPVKGESFVKFIKQSLSLLLSYCLVVATVPGAFAAQEQSTMPAPAQAAAPVQAAQQTPEQLQQMVAPIALYPDALVAQILAGAAYPDQIVEADRWLQQHSDLKGDQLGNEVDKQPWDPSVKALVEFPSVLANMDKNLSWTSSLGDAYVNQQQDVMNAVQTMRERADKAGNLKNTSQEKVSRHDKTIVIEPADPEVVYVPEYDPWLVYGEPIGIWPGWYSYPGLYIGGPGIVFGLGFGIGFFGGYGWGWGHWGYDWRRHGIMFDHRDYVSHSRVFYNRSHFDHAGGFHGAAGFHGGNSGFRGGASSHGFAGSHEQFGTHSGAFSGFNHGGAARGFSSRGQSSFGGGFHGGGGGFHGGGGHGGGGHR
jgi:hypothetical protein